MRSEEHREKRGIAAEDIEFLSNLQHEMRTQPTFAERAPRYWVIKDYRYRPAGDDDEVSRISICGDDGWEGDVTEEELLQTLADEVNSFGGPGYLEDWCYENRLHLEIAEDESFHVEPMYGVGLSADELESLWEKTHGGNETLSFETREMFFAPNTFFVTLRAAEEHLAANHYHYDPEARPYAMTAWRSPEVERLFEILQEVDFSSLPAERETAKESIE